MIERITGPDGLDFWIPTTPNVVTAELRAGGQWEPYLSALYPLACQPDSWTIEVGAYCGEHTIELLQFSRVAAFEPQEIPFACLCLNAALRAPWHWRASLQLLYAETGVLLAPVRYPVDHPDWIDHPSHDYTRATAGAETRTLDWVWLPELQAQKEVAFLKIDAQGCDLPILQGAEALVERDRPVICCEFEPALAEKHRHTAEDYRGWFAEHAYELWGFTGGNLLGVPAERDPNPFVLALESQGCVLTR